MMLFKNRSASATSITFVTPLRYGYAFVVPSWTTDYGLLHVSVGYMTFIQLVIENLTSPARVGYC